MIGTGSEVLGFDTERSTDHGWGPRLKVFVDAGEVAPVRDAIEAGLPDEFRGRPTRFGWDAVAVTSHVEVAGLGAWLAQRIGFDPRRAISTKHWLCAPQQRLLEVTSGAVFHDDGGELAAVRAALAWYPDDVWLWLLASQWRRLDQEEPFVGRTAEVGDELGSRVVAARLVRDVMRLAFLLERRYAPYSKWLGSGFARLDAAATLRQPLLDVLAARDYAAREAALVARGRRARKATQRPRDHLSRRPVGAPLPLAPVPGARFGPLRRGVPRPRARSLASLTAADRGRRSDQRLDRRARGCRRLRHGGEDSTAEGRS